MPDPQRACHAIDLKCTLSERVTEPREKMHQQIRESATVGGAAFTLKLAQQTRPLELSGL
jgi:hypothetical protein